MIASTINKDDLRPVLELLFYQNDSQAYVEYARIIDMKRESYKPVTYEGLEVLFSKIRKKIGKEQLKKTLAFNDIIPENVLHFDSTSLLPHIVWFCQAHRNTFLFRDGEGFLWYPHLIFALKNNELKVYATKTANIRAKTKLYKAPFPNVYGGSNICMGTINLSEHITGNYNQLMKNMERVFFGSKFTSELMDENRSKNNTNSLLKKLLNTERPFPKDTLVQINQTVEDVLHT